MNVVISQTGKEKNLWVFNPIGTGFVIVYNSNRNLLRWMNEATGMILEEQFVRPYKSINQFREESIQMYKTMIDDLMTTNLNYMDDPTIIETPLGNVAVDFRLLLN